MRTVRLTLLLAIAALAVSPAQPVGVQAIDATGVWLATDVPYSPWTVHLKQDGTKLTGTMEQNGGLRGTVNIYDGTITGSALSFKANSPDGARAITFTGQIHGDEITLHRLTRIVTNESAGGTGLFGTNAAPQFTIRRGVAATAATAPVNPIPAVRFTFKGVQVDITSIQSAPSRDAFLDGLRRQIDIVDEISIDQARKAFLKSVPIVIEASNGSDHYSSETRSVVLYLQPSYDPERPIVLHELLHAYHDQKLASGYANAEIRNLYQQARASGQFPANSYMLKNPVEYFAMMASIYLHGSAARDPFTRQAIKEKQPDCYLWLVKEFGPK